MSGLAEMCMHRAQTSGMHMDSDAQVILDDEYKADSPTYVVHALDPYQV